MPMMKDSGIEWIGEIPKEWELIKIKYLPNGEKDSFVDGDWIESSVITDSGIRYYTTGNIGDGSFKEQGNGFISEETFKLLGCKYAYAGDLIISRLNTPYGRSCLLPKHIEKCVVAVDNVILRTDENKQYLCYVTQCNGYQDSVFDKAAGTTMKRISRINLGNVFVPLPPRNIQDYIALFLNSKCAEIDALSAGIQEEIDTLKEYKKSVITEAVTKGLDPNVEMKDSGIDSHTTIPKEWNISRLGYECYIRARLGWKGLKADEYVDEGYAFISAFNIQNGQMEWSPLNYITKERYDESPEIKIKIGDVLIVKDGAGVGKCAKVDALPMGETAPNSSIGVITPFSNVEYRYVYYYLQSTVFNNFVLSLYNGMGVPHLTQEVLRNIKMPIPKMAEQCQIADYLDTKCKIINDAISEKQQQLAALDEYKKSVIYEYVTGKKEVPTAYE